VWESLVVKLGHRSSSLCGEEFLSAPIHSPLSGRLQEFPHKFAKVTYSVVTTNLPTLGATPTQSNTEAQLRKQRT
jgi:hypothetical protein